VAGGAWRSNYRCSPFAIRYSPFALKANMLIVENLHKRFQAAGGSEVRAVDGVSLSIPSGQILTLLGPSGCGKTTTLRCVAGLERPDSGRIVLGEETVFDAAKRIFVPPSDRGIGMVFQSYAIWPHMSVFENVAFPLRVARSRKYSSAEIKQKVAAALDMVRLPGFERRSATQLSGGQQQRLALARGLVHEPKILLLDEPLSNLDAKLREQMRFELKHLQRTLRITTVYVTHDQSEALALSDEIAVFNAGRVAQRGPPQEIYSHPRSRFVADFIGSANFIAGTVSQAEGPDGMAQVATPHGLLRCRFADAVRTGQQVVITARPEDLALFSGPPGDSFNALAGTVSGRIFLGDVMDYTVNIGDGELRVRSRPEHEFRVRQPVHIGIAPQKCVGLAE
jgi:iron(III) transport system ATP-binding protein